MSDTIIIPNISNYTLEFNDGNLIATPKINEELLTEMNYLKKIMDIAKSLSVKLKIVRGN